MTSICTPSIRLFVDFHSWTAFPSRVPASVFPPLTTHNPPRGQPPPPRSGHPFHLREASATH
ncbi:MAG: hypothetical protein ACOYZ6_15065 [Chloroflexota bacterium]